MAAIFYLAYGSNLHPLRLQQRVPSARHIGPVALPGFRLVFHKIGMDHSGKCDLLDTGYPADNAWGVLYQMDASDQSALTSAEGAGYRFEAFPVVYDGKPVEAMTFLAKPEQQDPAILPFDWYRDLVLAGARWNSLPEDYMAQIAQVPTMPDPDKARAQCNAELLDRLRLAEREENFTVDGRCS